MCLHYPSDAVQSTPLKQCYVNKHNTLSPPFEGAPTKLMNAIAIINWWPISLDFAIVEELPIS